MVKNEKYFILGILSISVIFSFSLWFSANAIIPQVSQFLELSDSRISFLSIILIIGFVIGGLISSLLNLPDILRTKNIFVISAFLGALANIGAIFFSSFESIIIFRFLTGFFLAGVYPTSIKIITTWFKESRGLAVGILLGALTLGSGLPYIFNLTGIPDWKILLSFSSGLSIIGGILVMLLVKEGKFDAGKTKFSFENIKKIVRNKPLRLASYGYFGHMWELYAMWVWMPLFLKSVYEISYPGKDATIFFSIGAFSIFLLGAGGSVFGGALADRYGRTKFNIYMLTISGISSILISFVYPNPYLVLIVALIWGLTIIPDSPQFSSMISELSDSKLVGTALTLQLTIGFLITIVSIILVPIFIEILGMRFAFSFLFIGPILGIWSLVKLRQLPDSKKIAHGKK